MIDNTGVNSKDPIAYDQRVVRGHDFLAYFKSHMTAICLLFWFFTISVSVTATAIYLLKEMEGTNQPMGPTTGETTLSRSGDRGREEEDSGDHDAYANYDVLGFLIDAVYAGDEFDSLNRSKQASKTKTTPGGTRTTEVIYKAPDDPGPGDYN